jgi:transposase
MAEKGCAFPAIAERLGRSRKSVESWAHANGVSTGKGRKWTARESSQAHALYARGMTCREIGEKLGRTQQSVNARLHKDGVTARERSGWRRVTMRSTRYALAREGFASREIIAVLGLTCTPRSLLAWMADYCKRAGLPQVKWRRGPQPYRMDLIEARRAELAKI